MTYLNVILAKFFEWFKFKNPAVFFIFSIVVAAAGPALTQAISLDLLKESPTLNYIIQVFIALAAILAGTHTTKILEKEENKEVKTKLNWSSISNIFKKSK